MDDEDFVANLRPDNVFGVGGLSDYFDDEDEDDYEEFDDVSSRRQTSVYRGTGSYPTAVSGETLEPGTPVAPQSNGKLGAAITLFIILGGAGLGGYYGGFKGAAGGALVGGALRNLYRAQRTLSAGGDTLSAVKQGAIGAVGAAGGGYLLWTANRK